MGYPSALPPCWTLANCTCSVSDRAAPTCKRRTRQLQADAVPAIQVTDGRRCAEGRGGEEGSRQEG